MQYYYLCDCQSITKNVFAKFHENIPNLSQETEKNTKNASSPSPQRNKTQNIPKQRAIPPVKFFGLTIIRVSSRIQVQNFLRNQTVLKKREKYHKTDQKVLKNGLQKETRACCEKYFQCSKHWSNTKNIFTNVSGKGFNGSP